LKKQIHGYNFINEITISIWLKTGRVLMTVTVIYAPEDGKLTSTGLRKLVEYESFSHRGSRL